MTADDDLLDLIRRTPWIEHLLTRCEFELGRAVDGPVEPLHLAGGEALEMIAGDRYDPLVGCPSPPGDHAQLS